MNVSQAEPALIWFGLSCYLVAWPLSFLRHRYASRVVVGVLFAAVAAVFCALGLRWQSAGYGPFLTLFEVLVSNLFSLGLIAAIAYARIPVVRIAARAWLPVMLLIGGWALTTSPEPGGLPATFDTLWLWAHVGFGKLFLGTLLVAFGLAIVLLVAPVSVARGGATAELTAELTMWRFASGAFVFETAMLITGSVWAHDAWGSYWAWDPVETWALLTWLALGVVLHLRLAWRLPEPVGRALILVVFILAFLTLFGIPFTSLGPHKGIV